MSSETAKGERALGRDMRAMGVVLSDRDVDDGDDERVMAMMINGDAFGTGDGGARAGRPGRPSLYASSCENGSSTSLVNLRDERAIEDGAFAEARMKSGEYLGVGACGTVRAGVHAMSGQVVALKTMKCYDRENAAQALNEIRILRRLKRTDRASVERKLGKQKSSEKSESAASDVDTVSMEDDGMSDPHSGIVRCIGAGFDVRANSMTLGLEIMALGSLERIWSTHGPMATAPRAAMAVLRCVTNGLAYLHEIVGVAHRDVKPSNILVDEDGACKLSDFGLCSPLIYDVGYVDACAMDKDDSIIRRVKDDAMVGTIAYMSPERVARGVCGDVADVWGMGITVLESVLGRGVYDIDDGGPLGLVVQICEDLVDVDGALTGTDEASKALRLALRRCLEKKPGRRATARELIFDEELNLGSYSCADVRSFIHHNSLYSLALSGSDDETGETEQLVVGKINQRTAKMPAPTTMRSRSEDSDESDDTGAFASSAIKRSRR